MAHPPTPPRHTHLTPAFSSPVTPPPPETSSTSLPTPSTIRRPARLDYDAMSDSKGTTRAFGGRPSPPASGATTPPPSVTPGEASPMAENDDGGDDDGFPTESELQDIQATLDGLDTDKSGDDAASQRDQLATMLRSLVDTYTSRVPFLLQQVAAQQETIATLQQQSRLSKCMIDIERDRFAAERTSWQAEIRALIRVRDAEAAAVNQPRRVLDLDVGYHKELENANKRLEMDNRLMAPRLVDTQQQIESLVTELRHLRTHVLLDTTVLGGAVEATAGPSGASASPAGPPTRQPQRQVNRNTMGDARAEHLLLAAKKVRSMRNTGTNVGRLTLDELQRHGVIGPDGGVGYSEGYGRDGEEVHAESDEEEKKVFASPSQERRGSASAAKGTPLLPRARKPAKRAVPTTPSRNRGVPQVPQTTPGGSNFNDLLLAAEMATRPGTPTRDHHPAHVMSATRSTTTARVPYVYHSPSKKQRRNEPPATIEWSTRRHLNQEGEGSPRRFTSQEEVSASALDLLAQASQDVAQSGGSAASRFEGMISERERRDTAVSSRSATPLGPAINLDDRGRSLPSSQAHTPARGFPSATQDDPFNDVANNTAAFQSPTGAAVPGLGKYVHLTSTMPARRVRSPYLKWTKEEDELLTRAVMEHGEKWDLVSKCVPTRSYHQVRQRWLRKTGAFDKKPANQTPGQTPTNDPSPLGRGSVPGEQASPTPKGRKRKDP